MRQDCLFQASLIAVSYVVLNPNMKCTVKISLTHYIASGDSDLSINIISGTTGSENDVTR